ncbi:MAG: hypothetical protein LC750_18750 [Actinobacteria bacterium]|nr:hypothetical protein [Actinomycetota bacterium]
MRIEGSSSFSPVELRRIEALIVESAELCWRGGMSFSEVEGRKPEAVAVSLTDDPLVVDLVDGRTVRFPSRGTRVPHIGLRVILE